MRFVTIVPYGLRRTSFNPLLAKSVLLWGRRLPIDVRMTSLIVAANVVRGGFAAKIAISALVIDVEFTGNILGIAVDEVGHNRWGFLMGN